MHSSAIAWLVGNASNLHLEKVLDFRNGPGSIFEPVEILRGVTRESFRVRFYRGWKYFPADNHRLCCILPIVDLISLSGWKCLENFFPAGVEISSPWFEVVGSDF
jgi:hypothetical protein